MIYESKQSFFPGRISFLKFCCPYTCTSKKKKKKNGKAQWSLKTVNFICVSLLKQLRKKLAVILQFSCGVYKISKKTRTVDIT